MAYAAPCHMRPNVKSPRRPTTTYFLSTTLHVSYMPSANALLAGPAHCAVSKPTNGANRIHAKTVQFATAQTNGAFATLDTPATPVKSKYPSVSQTRATKGRATKPRGSALALTAGLDPSAKTQYHQAFATPINAKTEQNATLSSRNVSAPMDLKERSATKIHFHVNQILARTTECVMKCRKAVGAPPVKAVSGTTVAIVVR